MMLILRLNLLELLQTMFQEASLYLVNSLKVLQNYSILVSTTAN